MVHITIRVLDLRNKTEVIFRSLGFEPQGHCSKFCDKIYFTFQLLESCLLNHGPARELFVWFQNHGNCVKQAVKYY